MKKFLNSAFTMAEAILVMTILGIIATIMISTLKPAEFKEKGIQVMAKKVLSEIDVATTQILMNNTADGTFDSVYEAGTSNVIIFTSFSDLKPMADKLGVLYKSYLTTLRKAPEWEYSTASANTFLLKDGAAIAVMFFGKNTRLDVSGTIFPGETNLTDVSDCVGGIVFDINDNEPPNVAGKDRFMLPLGAHGIKYSE